MDRIRSLGLYYYIPSIDSAIKKNYEGNDHWSGNMVIYFTIESSQYLCDEKFPSVQVICIRPRFLARTIKMNEKLIKN